MPMFRTHAGGNLFVTVNALLPNNVVSMIEVMRKIIEIWRDIRDEGKISKVCPKLYEKILLQTRVLFCF